MPKGVPEAQLAAACSDLSPVCPISPTKRDMMRAAVRSMSRCSLTPTGYCHPDIPPLCRRRPLLLQMEERNDKNTWRCPSQSADSEAGYWRSAHVCHCEAEHHLLRACCDENKGRTGRRGTRRGEVVWLGTEGVVCGITSENSFLGAFYTGIYVMNAIVILYNNLY